MRGDRVTGSGVRDLGFGVQKSKSEDCNDSNWTVLGSVSATLILELFSCLEDFLKDLLQVVSYRNFAMPKGGGSSSEQLEGHLVLWNRHRSFVSEGYGHFNGQGSKAKPPLRLTSQGGFDWYGLITVRQ